MELISINNDKDYTTLVIKITGCQIDPDDNLKFLESVFKKIWAIIDNNNKQYEYSTEICKQDASKIWPYCRSEKYYYYYLNNFAKICNHNATYFIRHKNNFNIGLQEIKIDNMNFDIIDISNELIARLLNEYMPK